MTLDLRGKKVVVIGGKYSIGRAIAEAVAREGADVLIGLRKGNDALNEVKELPMTHVKISHSAARAADSTESEGGG